MTHVFHIFDHLSTSLSSENDDFSSPVFAPSGNRQGDYRGTKCRLPADFLQVTQTVSTYSPSQPFVLPSWHTNKYASSLFEWKPPSGFKESDETFGDQQLALLLQVIWLLLWLEKTPPCTLQQIEIEFFSRKSMSYVLRGFMCTWLHCHAMRKNESRRGPLPNSMIIMIIIIITLIRASASSPILNQYVMFC